MAELIKQLFSTTSQFMACITIKIVEINIKKTDPPSNGSAH